MYVVIAGCVGVAIGLGLGLLTNRGRGAAFAGLAALGLLLGMILGLSASPVIGATLTAGFAVVGTMLQAYSSTKGSKTSESVVPYPDVRWLIPFATLCFVGVILGITMRANDLLRFNASTVNLKQHYLDQGFTELQAAEIMAAMAKNYQVLTPPKNPDPVADAGKTATNLQSQGAKADASLYLSIVEGMAGKNLNERLEALKERVSSDTREEIINWQRDGFDAESIFKVLKSQ